MLHERPKFVIQRQCNKGGETKHFNGFKKSMACKKRYGSCLLFDQNGEFNHPLKFIKTVFQDISNSEKMAKDEIKECHEDALEKAKYFLGSYEDSTLNQ